MKWRPVGNLAANETGVKPALSKCAARLMAKQLSMAAAAARREINIGMRVAGRRRRGPTGDPAYQAAHFNATAGGNRLSIVLLCCIVATEAGGGNAGHQP